MLFLLPSLMQKKFVREKGYTKESLFKTDSLPLFNLLTLLPVIKLKKNVLSLIP